VRTRSGSHILRLTIPKMSFQRPARIQSHFQLD
jgi:hypothetical protein